MGMIRRVITFLRSVFTADRRYDREPSPELVFEQERARGMRGD